jgi:hypothetical protein
MNEKTAEELQAAIDAMSMEEQLDLVLAQEVQKAAMNNDTILTVVVPNAELATIVRAALAKLPEEVKEVFTTTAFEPVVAESLTGNIGFVRMSDVQVRGIDALYVEFQEWLNVRFAEQANLPRATFTGADGQKFQQVPLVVPTTTFYTAYVNALVQAFVMSRVTKRIVTPTGMLKGQ